MGGRGGGYHGQQKMDLDFGNQWSDDSEASGQEEEMVSRHDSNNAQGGRRQRQRDSYTGLGSFDDAESSEEEQTQHEDTASKLEKWAQDTQKTSIVAQRGSDAEDDFDDEGLLLLPKHTKVRLPRPACVRGASPRSTRGSRPLWKSHGPPTVPTSFGAHIRRSRGFFRASRAGDAMRTRAHHS